FFMTITAPIAVAVDLPFEPPSASGLPVMNSSGLSLCFILYSSSIHDMTCAFVYTSGAGTSLSGPTNCEIARIYPRERPSSYIWLISFGLQMMPHLLTPYGRLTMPAFSVIHIVSDM